MEQAGTGIPTFSPPRWNKTHLNPDLNNFKLNRKFFSVNSRDFRKLLTAKGLCVGEEGQGFTIAWYKGPKDGPYNMQGLVDAFCTAISEGAQCLGLTLISSFYGLRFESQTPDPRRAYHSLTARSAWVLPLGLKFHPQKKVRKKISYSSWGFFGKPLLHFNAQ